MIMPNNCKTWMFHYVKPEKEGRFPYLRGLSVARFCEFLDQISAEGIIVHPDVFIDSVLKRIPLPKNSHMLTFDDGLQDHYRWVFPELKQRGLSALFFISSGALKCDRLLRVHKIHALYGTNGYAWLQNELQKVVGNLLDDPPDVFYCDPRAQAAYPFDDMSTAGFKYMMNYLMSPCDVDVVLDYIILNSFDESRLASEFYMSPEQIQEMYMGGMRFGYHGHTHRPFSQLSIEDLSAEMDTSFQHVGELFSEVPFCLSYPHGDPSSINAGGVKLLESKGIQVAFMAGNFGAQYQGALYLPRIDIAEWQKK
jgi:hypothetical protein